jgi:hypothetical protein
MKIGDVFEVKYGIKCNANGWQSIGVNSYNATNVYLSDFCHVKYQNYQYYKTINASDIWTNETPDVSIFVKNAPVPELPLHIMFIPAVACAVVVILRRKCYQRER